MPISITRGVHSTPPQRGGAFTPVMSPIRETEFLQPIPVYSAEARSITSAVAESVFGATFRKYAELETRYKNTLVHEYGVDWELYYINVRLEPDDTAVNMVYVLVSHFLDDTGGGKSATALMDLIRANKKRCAAEQTLYRASVSDVDLTNQAVNGVWRM